MDNADGSPPAPSLALSCCWHSQRHQDGHAMLSEAVELGFSCVELSHGVRGSLVPGILKGVEEGLVRVGSCHNFCPLPPGILHASPNLYQPSASDPRELDQWVRHTKRSIDFARMVGAGVLVCHLGSASFFWFDPATRMERYTERNPKADYREDEDLARVRAKALSRLRKAAPQHLVRVVDSIKRVLEHAQEKGVRLGFENRENFNELPLDDGFDALFAALPEGAPVGYWHDCGHADLKERLGLLRHREHLLAQESRLLGFHLHDVTDELRDHQEVGTGHIDFEMLAAFWKPHHRFVLELSPRLSAAQVSASRERIERLLARLA